MLHVSSKWNRCQHSDELHTKRQLSKMVNLYNYFPVLLTKKKSVILREVGINFKFSKAKKNLSLMKYLIFNDCVLGTSICKILFSPVYLYVQNMGIICQKAISYCNDIWITSTCFRIWRRLRGVSVSILLITSYWQHDTFPSLCSYSLNLWFLYLDEIVEWEKS